MKHLVPNKKGFTLVEMIVYIGIVSILLVAMIQFANSVVVISSKARTRHEVQQNARFAIERIVRDARSATDVNTGTSTFDVHPSVLSLAHDNPLRDPTIFSVSGGRLQVMEGSNGPYYLTSSDVTVTNFIVNDRSVSGRTKNLKIALTMQYANAASVEFNTSFDVQTAVVIRVQE